MAKVYKVRVGKRMAAPKPRKGRKGAGALPSGVASRIPRSSRRY